MASLIALEKTGNKIAQVLLNELKALAPEYGLIASGFRVKINDDEVLDWQIFYEFQHCGGFCNMSGYWMRTDLKIERWSSHPVPKPVRSAIVAAFDKAHYEVVRMNRRAS